VNDASSSPAEAADIARAISILQVTSNKVVSAVGQCCRSADELAEEDADLAMLFSQFSEKCQIILTRIADLRASESYKIAQRYQRVPQASWLPLSTDPFSSSISLFE